MKAIYSILLLAALVACSSQKKDNLSISLDNNVGGKTSVVDSTQYFYKIAHHWVLTKRRNKSGTKEMTYDFKGSKIVTQFESSGFFRTYDVLETKDSDGYNRTMSLRAIGMWDIFNNQELVMHFTTKDSIKDVKFYHIERLTKNELELRNMNRDEYVIYKRENEDVSSKKFD